MMEGKVITDLTMPKQTVLESLGKKVPSFREWRTGRNDAAMIPDKGFRKQLKKIDSDYDVVWDWGAHKWEIWCFPKEVGREPYHVLTVQTKGRTYRELGADVLLSLQYSPFNNMSAKKIADYLDEMDNQVRRRKQKEFKDLIEDIARDTFINIHCKIIQVPQTFAVERMVKNG